MTSQDEFQQLLDAMRARLELDSQNAAWREAAARIGVTASQIRHYTYGTRSVSEPILRLARLVLGSDKLAARARRSSPKLTAGVMRKRITRP